MTKIVKNIENTREPAAQAHKSLPVRGKDAGGQQTSKFTEKPRLKTHTGPFPKDQPSQRQLPHVSQGQDVAGLPFSVTGTSMTFHPPVYRPIPEYLKAELKEWGYDPETRPQQASSNPLPSELVPAINQAILKTCIEQSATIARLEADRKANGGDVKEEEHEE